MVQVHPMCNDAAALRLTAMNGFSRGILVLGTGTSLPRPLLRVHGGRGGERTWGYGRATAPAEDSLAGRSVARGWRAARCSRIQQSIGLGRRLSHGARAVRHRN
jgi:hypothetical protein